METTPAVRDTDGHDLVGLDIGGTKTHGIRFRSGRPVTEAKAGSANVQNVTVDQARTALADLFAALGPEPVARVIAGAGGVDTPEDARRLAALIAPYAPGARIDVVHDTRLILAAGGARTGIAVIAGTGAVAWGMNDAGAQARAGGWGYLLGDEGSGYWIGREAVRHALRQFNLGNDPDRLTVSLLRDCGLDEPGQLIGLFHGGTGRGYWAAKAQLVYAAAADGHGPSRAVIDAAAGYLCALAEQIADQLDLEGPVVVGGGMAANPLLQDRMLAQFSGAGLADVRFLTRDPVHGVVQLAADPSFGQPEAQ
jgi:glucosamine kinase